MMNSPNGDDAEVFKQLITAFDQANEERSHLVNRQGGIISDFVDRLSKIQYG